MSFGNLQETRNQNRPLDFYSRYPADQFFPRWRTRTSASSNMVRVLWGVWHRQYAAPGKLKALAPVHPKSLSVYDRLD
jgi:hypothetical protein